MEQLQCVYISPEELRFYGYTFDSEVLHHFIDLEIDEIYDLGYISVYHNGEERPYNYNTDPTLREIKFKNVIEILTWKEGSGWLDAATLRFTNGLYFSYGEHGTVNFQIDDEKLFYEYATVLLKQYGFYPDKIFEFTRKYPGCELCIERPNILTAVKNKDGVVENKFQ